MIFGRPTNLWLGLVTAVAGAVSVALITAKVDPTLVATLVGSGVTLMGAVIALVAGQPPTLNPGDQFKTVTPPGTPNYVTTVSTPPAPSTPTPIAPPPGG